MLAENVFLKSSLIIYHHVVGNLLTSTLSPFMLTNRALERGREEQRERERKRRKYVPIFVLLKLMPSHAPKTFMEMWFHLTLCHILLWHYQIDLKKRILALIVRQRNRMSVVEKFRKKSHWLYMNNFEDNASNLIKIPKKISIALL